MWAWLTGNRVVKTPKEMMQECQEDLAVARIQMQRNIQDMERDDAVALARAKRCMQDGKKKEAMRIARQVIRFRGACARMGAMVDRMQEVSINIQLMQSTHDMQRAMVGLTRAMAKINRKFNVASMANVMKHFEKETYNMDLSQDIMDDTMDESMSKFDDEEAENELLAKVMDEIGISIEEQLISVPTTTHRTSSSTTTSSTVDTSDITARLQNLRANLDNDNNATNNNNNT